MRSKYYEWEKESNMERKRDDKSVSVTHWERDGWDSTEARDMHGRKDTSKFLFLFF